MLKIDLLNNHISFIPELAKILHTSLGQWTPATIAEVEGWLHEWLNDSIPLAYVAIDGETPIGICSLQDNDGLDSNLKPWLGDLCVDEQYQNRGVGALLVRAINNKARELGFKSLYLIAPDRTIPEYYKRLGWKEIGLDKYHGHTVTIMQMDL